MAIIGNNPYYENAEGGSPIRYGANIIMDTISLHKFDGDFGKDIHINEIKVGLPIYQESTQQRRLYYKNEYITNIYNSGVWYEFDNEMLEKIGWLYDDSNRKEGINPITEEMTKPLYERWNEWFKINKYCPYLVDRAKRFLSTLIDADILNKDAFKEFKVYYTNGTYNKSVNVHTCFDREKIQLGSNQEIRFELTDVGLWFHYYRGQLRYGGVAEYENFHNTMQKLYKITHPGKC